MDCTLHIAGCIALCIGGFLLVGYLIKMLWNWLLPNITNIKRITYLQALGILILARLLFGGFGPMGVKCFSDRQCGWKNSECSGKWDGCTRGDGKEMEKAPEVK